MLNSSIAMPQHRARGKTHTPSSEVFFKAIMGRASHHLFHDSLHPAQQAFHSQYAERPANPSPSCNDRAALAAALAAAMCGSSSSTFSTTARLPKPSLSVTRLAAVNPVT